MRRAPPHAPRAGADLEHDARNPGTAALDLVFDPREPRLEAGNLVGERAELRIAGRRQLAGLVQLALHLLELTLLVDDQLQIRERFRVRPIGRRIGQHGGIAHELHQLGVPPLQRFQFLLYLRGHVVG